MTDLSSWTEFCINYFTVMWVLGGRYAVLITKRTSNINVSSLENNKGGWINSYWSNMHQIRDVWKCHRSIFHIGDSISSGWDSNSCNLTQVIKSAIMTLISNHGSDLLSRPHASGDKTYDKDHNNASYLVENANCLYSILFCFSYNAFPCGSMWFIPACFTGSRVIIGWPWSPRNKTGANKL